MREKSVGGDGRDGGRRFTLDFVGEGMSFHSEVLRGIVERHLFTDNE